jgi:hypothetical protein
MVVVLVAVPIFARLIGFVVSTAFWLFILVVMFEFAGVFSR